MPTDPTVPRRVALLGGIALAALRPAAGAEFPAPREATWIARLPLPHRRGAAGAAAALHDHRRPRRATGARPPRHRRLRARHADPAFAGELFGPGQPLDAARHFIILPDALGAGRSAKPSDGLRARFPRYNYDDMVLAQHRLVTEGLGLRRLRLVIGNSMGGMHAWLWGVTHPDLMDAIVPMAAQPTAMAGRNWMLRRLMVETIRRDPAYKGGDYAEQPPSLRTASVFYNTATNGGTLNLQAAAPTGEAADRLVEARLAGPVAPDANDFIWQWDSSRGYDPSPGLERIKARVLAINSADDERNPPETGLMQAAMRRVAHGRLLLIPASAETMGHGTTANARFWRDALGAFLRELP